MADTRLPTSNVRPVPAHFPGEKLEEEGPWIAEVELREYWRIISKHRFFIAASVVLALLISLIYVFTVTPEYMASSKVRITSYEPVLSATKIENILEERTKDMRYLETQIQEIKSFSLADRVLESEKIRDAIVQKQVRGKLFSLFSGTGEESSDFVEYADPVSGYRHPLRYLKSYLDKISVKPVRKTSLVIVEARDDDPVMAALIANSHAEAYIDWVRSVRVDRQSRGLTFLRAQAEELREKVSDLEREIADYAEAHAIVALNKDENIVVRRMSDLNRLLTEANAKRIQAVHLYNEALESGGASAGFDDSSLQDMRSDLARLEAEYGQLSAKFTASYPKVKQIRAQITGLKKAIAGQEKKVVAGLKARALAAQEEEENLREELEQQKSKAFELSKRQVQYNVLNRELSISRELLQNVLRQIKETSLAVESNSANVSIVDYAVTPLVPSFPRKKLIVILGVIIGLGVGIGVAFLISYLDNTIRTPEEIEYVLRLPSLGVVPSFEIESGEAVKKHSSSLMKSFDPKAGEIVRHDHDGNLPIVFFDNPKSLASEAYRTIRTGILLSQAGEPPKSLLITSAQSSEGKTTSVMNLAASLTGAGGRVALIDADLRRPSVLKYFNRPTTLPGLVEVLTNQATLESVMLTGLVRRLTVIPSGNIPPNPAELLGSLEMASLIDRLAADFDYVLIDCPPVLPVTDSVVLSRYVDGVVMVVKGALTPRRVVIDAKNRLLSVGARILGIVLNDVDVTAGDYYYYNRYYYSYYHDDSERHSSNVAV